MLNKNDVTIGVDPRFRGLRGAQKNWGWFLAFGLLLVVLGTLAISASFFATIFSVVLFGFVLMTAAVIQFVHACMSLQWKGLFLSLLLGVLYFVTGILCVARPEAAAISLTLWIAAFCFIGGLFRIISSALFRFDHWRWVFFNGSITFILGILILADWPLSGLWVIGLFLGIDMILSGWTYVLLATASRKEKIIK